MLFIVILVWSDSDSKDFNIYKPKNNKLTQNKICFLLGVRGVMHIYRGVPRHEHVTSYGSLSNSKFSKQYEVECQPTN